jgi:poly(A) polymerase
MIALPGMDLVWDALPEARMVGGAVRDMLVGCPVADVDFASPLPPEVVMKRARAAGLKAVPTGLAHGTITVVAAGRGFEVTTLRRDVATDGRHAVVEFTDDWREDASRRDFTINAMSATRDGTVHDYFGGREDLAAGRVRFVGEAATRIREDYLRVLRFFRFFTRYGRGEPDAAAVAAITALREGVKSLSAERVWSEIKLILKAADPVPALRLMAGTGVLELVLPGADVEHVVALMARGAPVDPLLRVAALGPGEARAFARRWKLSRVEETRLAGLLCREMPRPEDDDAVLRRALAADEAAVLADRVWLYGGAESGWERLRARLLGLERPVFPLQGRDLTAMGVTPGPDLGALLREVQGWWLAGGCMADAEVCRAWVRTRLGG